jgi:hypothetical protein
VVLQESVKWNTLFDKFGEWESYLKAEEIDIDAILQQQSQEPDTASQKSKPRTKSHRHASQMRGPSR